MKKPILPNNFETESNTPENDAKNARFVAEMSSENAPTAPQNAPSDAPVGASGARPATEGSSVSPLPEGEGLGVRGAKRGPKTPRGKRAISRNAVKHAILSPHPVAIAGVETIDDWEKFEAEIIESWVPEGRYERELARDIAFCLWRLRRCRVNESAVLAQQVEEEMRELLEPQYEDDEDGCDQPQQRSAVRTASDGLPPRIRPRSAGRGESLERRAAGRADLDRRHPVRGEAVLP